jgi:dTDP-4-amino-4,6-dideoxygalactose transaminase
MREAMNLIGGVRIISVPTHADARGQLTAFDRDFLPFEPVRTFVISNVPSEAKRGEHLVSCHQFLWMQSGKCLLTLSSGLEQCSLLLNSSQWGVFVPRGLFLELAQFHPDSVLVVSASASFAESKQAVRHSPARTDAIPQADPSRRFEQHGWQVQSAIRRVFDSGQFILGAEVAALEDEFARYLGVRHAVGVSSGTQAITLALRSLGLGAGDEILTTSLTSPATALAIEAAGARVVFVDVDRTSRCIDPAAIEAAIGPATAAIVPVHLHGFPAAMDDIMRIATRHGLAVVEDCAQSHGASIAGRRTGTFGHAAAFSFYPTKPLAAAGDGGAVVTRDPNVAERIRRLGNCGFDDARRCVEPGINGRLDELQAAILRVQLPTLDAENDRRRALAALYRTLLDDRRVELPAGGDGEIYHQFCVGLDRRDQVRRNLLTAHRIDTAVHYSPPVHQHPHFERGQSLPVTEELAARLLSLPIQSDVVAGQSERIASALLESVDACRS